MITRATPQRRQGFSTPGSVASLIPVGDCLRHRATHEPSPRSRPFGWVSAIAFPNSRCAAFLGGISGVHYRPSPDTGARKSGNPSLDEAHWLLAGIACAMLAIGFAK